MVVRGSKGLGSIVAMENLAESLRVAFDAGAKRILLPMASVRDIPTIPGGPDRRRAQGAGGAGGKAGRKCRRDERGKRQNEPLDRLRVYPDDAPDSAHRSTG